MRTGKLRTFLLAWRASTFLGENHFKARRDVGRRGTKRRKTSSESIQVKWALAEWWTGSEFKSR